MPDPTGRSHSELVLTLRTTMHTTGCARAPHATAALPKIPVALPTYNSTGRTAVSAVINITDNHADRYSCISQGFKYLGALLSGSLSVDRLERVDHTVAREEHVQSSEPNVLAGMAAHRRVALPQAEQVDAADRQWGSGA